MDKGTFDLGTFLPYRLAVLAERVSRRLAVEYGRSHGLGVPEWRVMVHVLNSGAVSVRDIHSRVNLEKPRVSRAVSRLEAEGLVRKEQSETDARLVSITLTETGQAALEDIIPVARAIEAQLIDAVGPDDLATFFRVMETMHAVLDGDSNAKARS